MYDPRHLQSTPPPCRAPGDHYMPFPTPPFPISPFPPHRSYPSNLPPQERTTQNTSTVDSNTSNTINFRPAARHLPLHHPDVNFYVDNILHTGVSNSLQSYQVPPTPPPTQNTYQLDTNNLARQLQPYTTVFNPPPPPPSQPLVTWKLQVPPLVLPPTHSLQAFWMNTITQTLPLINLLPLLLLLTLKQSI
jgi:hypothetical protein